MIKPSEIKWAAKPVDTTGWIVINGIRINPKHATVEQLKMHLGYRPR